MVNIGIVGSGFMAETHTNAYNSIDGANIVAVASPNTADEFIEEHQLEADSFRTADELLEDATVDVIDVCSPTPTHRPVVETAAAAGIDVFCEKPVAGSLEDAQAIADAAADADIAVMVGHVLRFFPQYAQARDVVEDGGIGNLGVARARRLSAFPDWGHGNWYADRDQSGGVLLDLAIHDLDFLRWVGGDVERVFARRTRWDEGEHGHVTLRFADGAVGYVEASWGLPAGQELTHSFELAGDDGLLEFDGEQPAMTTSTEQGTTHSSPLSAGGYQRQLEAFLESIQAGREPPVTVEDGIETLRLSVAANRSAAEGRPVALEEVKA
ncbi:Gfo/Idh/MocA family oxidoreductase [Halobacteria archaeon AArc-curdl1]|uniref:Gfo/Idh/MocA family oxidoreductase n=1 Tax=Natronosalvus hydrolyticus TaxID=2979988 RepID=A0AAP2Z6S7_9EURY|nr:Gfo/Idh/MocA family oxidoreductase [Halobacteria archaeon AArc-curdl1]